MKNKVETKEQQNQQINKNDRQPQQDQNQQDLWLEYEVVKAQHFINHMQREHHQHNVQQ